MEEALKQLTSYERTINKLIKEISEQGPKMGHWIEHPHECGENWEYPKYECSECSEWEENDSEYCPNCGAKMIDQQEREE